MQVKQIIPIKKLKLPEISFNITEILSDKFSFQREFLFLNSTQFLYTQPL